MARVLIIDDELRVGEAVRFAFERHGFVITQATNGVSGHALAREDQPDCILLDVGLAGEDGVELCRALKSDPRTASLPVILLSGLTDAASLRRGLEVGADDYVTKPFNPVELRARIERHIKPVA